MSIFKKDTVVENHPAYVIVTRKADSQKCINISAGDQLIVGMSTYIVGSAASYALSSNHCPVKSYNRCIELGHETHWINQNSVCISNYETKQEKMLQVDFDAVYRFEGKTFKIVTFAFGSDNLVFEFIEDDNF